MMDIDNDTDLDVIFSESECSNLYLLRNQGSMTNPSFSSTETFPANDKVHINIFPAAFYEDVDFDGVKDLISSPNNYRREYLDQDFRRSTWMYKNMDSDVSPDFVFTKKDFLQEEMIDVGDNSAPAFCDEDGDGDLDLFIGNNSDASGSGTIFLYRNIGTASQPHFKLENEDYSNLKSLDLNGIKPQFADVNGDGRIDLALAATDNTITSGIYYIPNTSETGLLLGVDKLKKTNVSISNGENFHFTDINRDGKIDLLIGNLIGGLEFWENVGLNEPSFDLQDVSYLGISPSTDRQTLAPFTADLNNDGEIDLMFADQRGRLSIIDDFRTASDIRTELTDIVFNPLNENYESTRMGRVWPTAVTLFESKRPAIVLGTTGGGLKIYRNEEKEVNFTELRLSVYPNPVTAGTVFVKSNLTAVLKIVSLEGKEFGYVADINVGTMELSVQALAKGLYVFKFELRDGIVYRRVLVE